MKKIKDKIKKPHKLPKKWRDAVESVVSKKSPIYRTVSNPIRDLESSREDIAMAAFVWLSLGEKDVIPDTEKTRRFKKELDDA